jgi:hypothetical protein
MDKVLHVRTRALLHHRSQLADDSGEPILPELSLLWRRDNEMMLNACAFQSISVHGKDCITSPIAFAIV